jgi:transcriptional regulator with XRE-family HTH domain
MMIERAVGLRIKELRANVSITQEELAFRAELDRTYINSIENGRRNISIVNIEKIAAALVTR